MVASLIVGLNPSGQGMSFDAVDDLKAGRPHPTHPAKQLPGPTGC
jgi:hypothetical protein